MSKEIKELAEKLFRCYYQTSNDNLSCSIKWSEVSPFERGKFLNMADIASGYRKPAPSEKLVEEIKEKLADILPCPECRPDCPKERYCTYKECSKLQELIDQIIEIASLLPEMKLIGDEEIYRNFKWGHDIAIEEWTANGGSELFRDLRAIAAAQLAADRKE